MANTESTAMACIEPMVIAHTESKAITRTEGDGTHEPKAIARTLS